MDEVFGAFNCPSLTCFAHVPRRLVKLTSPCRKQAGIVRLICVVQRMADAVSRITSPPRDPFLIRSQAIGEK